MKTRKCILLMACIIATMVLTGCGKTKINLNDYFKYEVVGANGYGTLKFERDEDRIVNDIALAKKLSEDQAFALYYPMEEILYNNGSWNKEDMLSNGDVIKYKFSLDDSVNKMIDGIEFTWSDIEYRVDGLSEAVEFDPFDKLNINFVGVSGEAELRIDGNQYKGITYTADKNWGIKNGETVTITADIKDMDSFINQYGMIPVTTTKEYIVEGLDSYVLTDEIATNENLEIIKSEAVEKIYDYFAHFAYFDFRDEGFIETPSAFWNVSADITGDIEMLDILYGNGKADEGRNFISAFLKVPYVVNAVTQNKEEKELGSGDAYFSVTIKNNILTEQGLAAGTVKELNVKSSKDALIASLSSLKKEYTLSDIIGDFSDSQDSRDSADVDVKIKDAIDDPTNKNGGRIYVLSYSINGEDKEVKVRDHCRTPEQEYFKTVTFVEDLDSDGENEVLVNLFGDYVEPRLGLREGSFHIFNISDNKLIEIPSEGVLGPSTDFGIWNYGMTIYDGIVYYRMPLDPGEKYADMGNFKVSDSLIEYDDVEPYFSDELINKLENVQWY